MKNPVAAAEWPDAHTHQLASGRQLQLLCITGKDLAAKRPIPPIQSFSAGLLPEDLELKEQLLPRFTECIQQPQCKAIGECGFDARYPDLNAQTELVQIQYNLSIQLQKPIIWHIVKSWEAFFRFQQQHPPQTPWILHGFIGSTGIARRLLHTGCYLSLGIHALKSPKTLAAIPLIPPDQLLLESDTQNPDLLPELYQKIARIRNTTTEILQQQILCNFTHLFLQS